MMRMGGLTAALAIAAVAASAGLSDRARDWHADSRRHRVAVVVYGGTAGGVIAAVAAAREGLASRSLEPGRHLGGMVSGGLGWTDYGRKEVIGGYSLEFFERVGRKYGRPTSSGTSSRTSPRRCSTSW